MSGIFGHLNLSDGDYVYNATQGQRVIYDAVQEYVNRVTNEMMLTYSLFIEETTDDHKRRYKLPGGGHLQKIGEDGRPGAVKAYGEWDVGFPLEEYAAAIADNRVNRAYMTVGELDRHVQTVVNQNVNTVRWELLHRLFDNVQLSFSDGRWGTITVEPLANGDTVTYPPVLGSESDATENHYAESGYTAANISDTNNPFETIRDELEEHFGTPTGGSEIVVFINNAQRTVVEDLTDFDPVADSKVRAGDDTDLTALLPANMPGRILGSCNQVWVVEWRWIPANYMFGLHLGMPAPLIRRIDPAETGLGDGLQLVSEDEEYPFKESFWSHRFGLGAGNRLNGYAFELGTGGTYTIPTTYD